MTGITKDKHWFTDYSYVPLVMAAPKLVGFEKSKDAALLCKVLSSGVLTYSLLTDMKMSAAKLLPYKAHALLDFATGLLALAAPWVWQFANNKKARNTFLLMGITGLVVGTLSVIGDAKKPGPSVSNKDSFYH